MSMPLTEQGVAATQASTTPTIPSFESEQANRITALAVPSTEISVVDLTASGGDGQAGQDTATASQIKPNDDHPIALDGSAADKSLKKKKKSSKASKASRGTTALPRSRGTGLEGWHMLRSPW